MQSGAAYDAQQDAMSSGAPVNSGNLLERLLPTAGAVIGGTLGLPGDIFSGGAASVGGAALGDTAGRALENLLTHQNVKNNLGSSAVQGTLGQIGGIGLSKALGSGSSILSNLGGKYAQKGAAADTEEALSNAFPDQALNANDRKALNFGQSLDLADTAGIDKTPEAFLQAQQAASGGGAHGGILNGTLDSIVTGAGPVNLQGYGDVVDSALNDNVGSLGSIEPTTGGRGGAAKAATNAATNTKQLFENMLQQTGYKGQGSLTGNADPDAALTLLRNIGEQGSRFAGAGYNAPGTPQAAMEDVFSKVYGGLRNMIYNRPEIDQAVSQATLGPDDEAAILKAAGGNQQLASHLINTVNDAQRARDITGVESQYVDMGKAGQKALNYTQNALGTGKTAQAAREEAQAPASKAKSLIQGAGTLGAVTGHPLGLLAVAAPKALEVAGPKVLGTGGGILGALGNPVLDSSVLQTASNLPNEAAPPASLQNNNQLSNNGGVMNPAPASPNIFSALANPQAPGNQNLAPIGLQALMGMFDPYLLNSGVDSGAQSAEQNIQKANVAASLLPTLQSEFGQAGGGQGLIGGLLSRLGGILPGSPASNYNAQANSVAGALTNAGLPESPSALPQLTQSTQTATDTIQRLQSLLQALGATQPSGTLAQAAQ